MPLPGPFLLPSPYLLPGRPGPFSDIVVEATAPWADPNGVWSGYNAALATMFEPIYDIVADQGDVSQTIVGTLSSPLSTVAEITSLPVQSVSQFIQGGTEVTLASSTESMVFLVSFAANVGDTTIFVESEVPNFSYPVGSPVQLNYTPGWSTLLDPINCPDQFLTFLGQFNGTDIPVGLDAATARLKIASENAEQRGTSAAITAAVQRNLTGTQSVSMIERVDAGGNPNSYYFTIVVHPSEVTSTQAITEAVNAVKPGGVLFTLVVSDAWVWNQAIHTWNADTISWDAVANLQP